MLKEGSDKVKNVSRVKDVSKGVSKALDVSKDVSKDVSTEESTGDAWIGDASDIVQLAVAVDGRLVVKRNEANSPSPVSFGVGVGVNETVRVVVMNFQCQEDAAFLDSGWTVLAASLLVSFVVVRCFGGCVWATAFPVWSQNTSFTKARSVREVGAEMNGEDGGRGAGVTGGAGDGGPHGPPRHPLTRMPSPAATPGSAARTHGVWNARGDRVRSTRSAAAFVSPSGTPQAASLAMATSAGSGSPGSVMSTGAPDFLLRTPSTVLTAGSVETGPPLPPTTASSAPKSPSQYLLVFSRSLLEETGGMEPDLASLYHFHGFSCYGCDKTAGQWWRSWTRRCARGRVRDGCVKCFGCDRACPRPRRSSTPSPAAAESAAAGQSGAVGFDAVEPDRRVDGTHSLLERRDDEEDSSRQSPDLDASSDDEVGFGRDWRKNDRPAACCEPGSCCWLSWGDDAHLCFRGATGRDLVGGAPPAGQGYGTTTWSPRDRETMDDSSRLGAAIGGSTTGTPDDRDRFLRDRRRSARVGCGRSELRCRCGRVSWMRWHFVTYIHALACVIFVIWANLNMRQAVNQLANSFQDPRGFYQRYLVDRVASSSLPCPDGGVGACYCNQRRSTRTFDALEPFAHEPGAATALRNAAGWSSGDRSRVLGADDDWAAPGATECPASGIACSGSQLELCAMESCDSVWYHTGNCVGSVFEYTCGCSSTSCDQSTFNVTQSSPVRADGLVAGFESCIQHHEFTLALLWVTAAFFVAIVICMLACFKRCVPGHSSRESDPNRLGSIVHVEQMYYEAARRGRGEASRFGSSALSSSTARALFASPPRHEGPRSDTDEDSASFPATEAPVFAEALLRRGEDSHGFASAVESNGATHVHEDDRPVGRPTTAVPRPIPGGRSHRSGSRGRRSSGHGGAHLSSSLGAHAEADESLRDRPGPSSSLDVRSRVKFADWVDAPADESKAGDAGGQFANESLLGAASTSTSDRDAERPLADIDLSESAVESELEARVVPGPSHASGAVETPILNLEVVLDPEASTTEDGVARSSQETRGRPGPPPPRSRRVPESPERPSSAVGSPSQTRSSSHAKRGEERAATETEAREDDRAVAGRGAAVHEDDRAVGVAVHEDDRPQRSRGAGKSGKTRVPSERRRLQHATSSDSTGESSEVGEGASAAASTRPSGVAGGGAMRRTATTRRVLSRTSTLSSSAVPPGSTPAASGGASVAGSEAYAFSSMRPDTRMATTTTSGRASGSGSGRCMTMVPGVVVAVGGVLLFVLAIPVFGRLKDGRTCTGEENDSVGQFAPVVGSQVNPADSLILVRVPGCTFGSPWRDDDLEGRVVSAGELSVWSQMLAVLFLFIDVLLMTMQFSCFLQNLKQMREHFHQAFQRASGGTVDSTEDSDVGFCCSRPYGGIVGDGRRSPALRRSPSGSDEETTGSETTSLGGSDVGDDADLDWELCCGAQPRDGAAGCCRWFGLEVARALAVMSWMCCGWMCACVGPCLGCTPDENDLEDLPPNLRVGRRARLWRYACLTRCFRPRVIGCLSRTWMCCGPTATDELFDLNPVILVR